MVKSPHLLLNPVLIVLTTQWQISPVRHQSLLAPPFFFYPPSILQAEGGWRKNDSTSLLCAPRQPQPCKSLLWCMRNPWVKEGDEFVLERCDACVFLCVCASCISGIHISPVRICHLHRCHASPQSPSPPLSGLSAPFCWQMHMKPILKRQQHCNRLISAFHKNINISQSNSNHVLPCSSSM